ncbi:Adenylate cyclase, class 3 [Pedococcus cremeus]|uniref:Adenylate cyclase, class 3 n=1 Tax=Pedococcus cremeus TaxID=587636 RepID=A0A1H9XRG2_9MICO|nr:adenylate/guanylate cyclase domain-containing protein [Pedococcus cremeus]SES48730.1 Adenylate cyclase, class 3 [Pedococcus cremeus]
MIPRTQYAPTATGDLAYKVCGQGPRDLVFSPAFASNLDVFWEHPEHALLLERLSSLGRLITFDKRGSGLSERSTESLSLEQASDDIVAVMDAAGSERAVLIGWLDAGAAALATAARHPDRVEMVVAGEVTATGQPGEDGVTGWSRPDVSATTEVLAAGGWGQAVMLQRLAPELAANPRVLDWWSRYESASATPTAAVRLLEAYTRVDLRPHLAHVRAPVLLLHDSDFPLVTQESIEWLASQLANATLKIVHARLPLTSIVPTDEVIDETEEHLTGTRNLSSAATQVAALLFTDVVGSTQELARTGDVSWGHLLSAHRAAVRRSIDRFGGHEVDTTGDGFLATFPVPSAALRCGSEIVTDAPAYGLQVRAGVHAGEILVRDDDVMGVTVHIAARVASSAGPGDVLVTDTVRTMLAGAGLRFTECGEHQLKGVPGVWRLFRLQTPVR